MKSERDRRSLLRRLTAEEAALWRRVTRTIVPRPGAVLPPEPLLQTASTPAAAATELRPPEPPPQPKKKTPPAPTSLDPALRRRLARGRGAIDDVLDLHGLNQPEAHSALIGFLIRNQARGSKLVLVVTGKGRAAAPNVSASEGVLRRQAPLWLHTAPLRALVVSFEEASPKHGGSGALYVRIRKGRENLA